MAISRVKTYSGESTVAVVKETPSRIVVCRLKEFHLAEIQCRKPTVASFRKTDIIELKRAGQKQPTEKGK